MLFRIWGYVVVLSVFLLASGCFVSLFLVSSCGSGISIGHLIGAAFWFYGYR